MSSSSSPGLPYSRSISRTFSIQSIPRSVLSTPSSVGECSPPRGFGRGKCERVNMGSPESVHSRTTSGDSLILLRHLRRQVSAASIPIFFENISQPHLSTDDFEETLQHVSADEAQNVGKSLFVSPQLLAAAFGQNESAEPNPVDDPCVSFATSLERPSNAFMRRLSSTSGLTMESLSSACTTEPPTPSDNTFAMEPSDPELVKSDGYDEFQSVHGTHATMPTADSSHATVHQRTGSEASTTSAFTISEYYGSPDCSGDTHMVALETLVSPIDTTQAKSSKAPSDSLTPTTDRRPKASIRGVAQTPGTTPKPIALARKLTFNIPAKTNLRKEDRGSVSDEVCGAVTRSIEESGASQIPPVGPLRHASCPSSPPSQYPEDHIKPGPSPIQARRRAIYPHTPLAIVLPAPTSNPLLSLDTDSVASSSGTADSSFTGSTLDSPSTNMYQIIQPDQFFPSNGIHPITPNTGDSFHTSNTNQIPFHSLDKSILHTNESDALPVGELFRTLQIWFDQEGFREIAPVFRFNYYNREDDLLYFTTERVGYPFHYDSMQQVPVLRKVVAPDYEEAYVLLEGKSHRNAAGRRDFISRQANLDMKNAGKYVVEDKEGKGGKWIWRLVYEVEERKSLMGKPMLGERAFIPITFACSPEILDPSHARKPTLLNSIIKNMGSKKTAVALNSDGRPTTRPRGKSLMGYHSRKLSESTTRLLRTPPRHQYQPNPPTSDSIPSPDTFPSSTSAQSNNDDELSRAQAHFFRTIAPASASRLRPMTAFDEENVAKRNLRKAKTNEQLRRPFTADAARSGFPGRTQPPLPIVPVFGMAPQPSRATPHTAGNRFQSRPKTADDRRPRTAKSQLDVRRIAAASFYTPASGSP
ncbi:hypothetical protein PGT21_029140 [Puccinia graminis f. sp. tritici]|uniref:Uncharacterized protein n=1 Tax=Puccinia graminis f. sp. tritici TaxID=56615 RepID=A0A5B0LPP8_PUCGR|nr:hypothetical protein PGT21_029140 [Puccinia graminis f. sp. tritici]KAA1095609.1 hypothetical protein PGTUg99_009261 [Puccinia graminis f. sp. tritici]